MSPEGKRTMEFRLIYEPECTQDRYMSHDFAVMELMNGDRLPPTVMVKGWKRPFIGVGYYQDLDDDVDVEMARERGWGIDRRKAGAGLAFLDLGVMNLKLFCPSTFFPNLEQAIVDFGKVHVETSRKLGVQDALYKHIGDVLVGNLQGKKLGAATAFLVDRALYVGGYLNLRRPDLETLERIVKTPPEKFSDKALKSATERSTSVEEETGRPVAKDRVREAFAKSIEEVLHVVVRPGVTTLEEEEAMKRHWQAISTDEWIYRRSSKRRFAEIPPGFGFSRKRYKALKLVCACVLADEGRVIRDIMIYGDFFARPVDFVDDLEGRLVGVSVSDEGRIQGIVDALFSRPEFECSGISPQEFARPILEACRELSEGKG